MPGTNGPARLSFQRELEELRASITSIQTWIQTSGNYPAKTLAMARDAERTSIPSNSLTAIPCKTTVQDFGSPTPFMENGLYVVRSAGLYQIFGQVAISEAPTAGRGYCEVQVTSAGGLRGTLGTMQSAGFSTFAVAGVMKLAPLEKVGLYAWHNAAGTLEAEPGPSMNYLHVYRIA